MSQMSTDWILDGGWKKTENLKLYIFVDQERIFVDWRKSNFYSLGIGWNFLKPQEMHFLHVWNVYQQSNIYCT